MPRTVVAGALSRHPLLAAPVLAVAVAATVGVGSAYAPILALAAVAALGVALVAVWNMTSGVLLLTLVSFFDRGTALGGAGLSPAKLVGILVVLAWLWYALRSDSELPMLFREQPVLAALLVTLVGWALASVAFATDPHVAAGEAFRLAQNAILVFIVFAALRERKHLWWFVGAFVAGTVGSVLLGLTGIYGTMEANDYRLSGGFDDPNQLGAAVVPAIILVGFAFIVLEGRRARWLVLLCLPLLGDALFKTESQFSILALGFGLALAIVYGGSGRRYIMAAVSAAVLFVVGYYTFYQPPTIFTTMFSHQNTGGRSDLWKVAVEMAKTRPLTGVGAGNFVVNEPSYALSDMNLTRVDIITRPPHVVHNTYLETLTELGIVGLSLLLAVLAAPVVLSIKAVRAFRRVGDRSMELLARAVVVAALAMDAAFFDFSAEVAKQLWLVVGFGAALWAYAQRREAEGSNASHEGVRPEGVGVG